MNDYIFEVQTLSNEELFMIINNSEDHELLLVDAAIEEARNRNILEEENSPTAEVHEINSYIYAGIFERSFAYIIDGIILLAPIWFFQIAIIEPGETKIDLSTSRILTFLIWLIYYTVLEGSGKQATWGKRLLGLKVIYKNDQPLTYKIAAIRYLSMIFSILPLGIGFFSIIWDKHSQEWHDMIADCYVIKNK